jgi:hypothetical protein
MKRKSDEATACDGLRDDDPARAVSDQMNLLRAGLTEQPIHLDGELLHRGSEPRVGDCVDGHASGAWIPRERRQLDFVPPQPHTSSTRRAVGPQSGE